MRLFDEPSARVDDLTVTWNAAEGPDGSRTAILLEDRSKIYGSIMQEVPVGNDNKTHTISIDFKADASPIAEIVMIYQDGGQQKTYYAFVHLNNPFEDICCRRARDKSAASFWATTGLESRSPVPITHREIRSCSCNSIRGMALRRIRARRT
jgi:hypothetical protein